MKKATTSTSTTIRTFNRFIYRKKAIAKQSTKVIVYPYPILAFNPSIHTIYNCKRLATTSRVMELFKNDKVVGFDMEWTPTLIKGAGENKTDLIQICGQSAIALIHITHMTEFPPELQQFIESDTVIKVGNNIKGDARKLYRDFKIRLKGCVDCTDIVNQMKHPDIKRPFSLDHLCEQVLKLSLPKDPFVRMSEWNGTYLTAEQNTYAANDAYASLMLHLALEKLAIDLDKDYQSPIKHADELIKATIKREEKENAQSSVVVPVDVRLMDGFKNMTFSDNSREKELKKTSSEDSSVVEDTVESKGSFYR